MRRWFAVWFILVGLTPAEAYEFWPGAHYDARIPTFRQVLGYEPGERITSHAGILRYLDALAAASPRIKVVEYGASWEGRKLVYAVLGSESNMSKLDAIRSTLQRFADPRKTSAAEARTLTPSLPAVVWLASGVHGDETSAPEAALLTAYHLLAARNDKMVDAILANDLVLLDPLQNPDGRERFLNYYEQTRGAEPDDSPAAAEHNQPWPGGRYNHYLFDLNRDWIALTQPEIRDEVKVLRQWLPLVAVDLHEMGSDSTYFFSPEADPYNPNLTPTQRESLQLFGRNNAKWFDQYGFDYFTREVYDAFYPGYGASWPSYYGSLAMTYEQASARGLEVRRSDGTLLGLRDTIRHHFVASLATLETAAQNREKLLDDFYRYRASAIEEGGKEPVREYVLPRSRDASATDKLAAILGEHGIEVQRAAAAFHAGGREYPAGTYVVRLAQPAKRLIHTLLDPQTAMDERFIKAEETRRQLKERSEIYDVTAWSLPLLFNVEAVPQSAVSEGSFEAAAPGRVPAGELHGAHATVAYVAPWGSEAAGRLLAAALRRNLKVSTGDRSFALEGRTYPAGSLIFKVNDNPPDVAQTLTQLAREAGADLYATNTGWVEDGVNFGSRYVLPVRKPSIALAWDAPVRAPDAGATRFVLERQYGYPVTLVRAAQLGAADLSKFNVLILPPGGDYKTVLDEDGIDRLKNWVDAGGTLVALGNTVDFLADPKVALLDIAQENALRPGEKPDQKKEEKNEDKAEKTNRVPGTEIVSAEQYRDATQATAEPPDGAPGAILRATVQPNYWLTAGAGDSVNAMVAGRAIYAPLKADQGVNAAYFQPADTLLAGGYLWSENRRQMAYKPLVVTEDSGRGLVVGFTADPNFRGMLDGMNLLFLNAVFRGPAHARKAGAE
ncbi:MAG: peptidase M14 [Acidobacteriia bacterium]|nr:peptidase M14 [Terriglobia bacterium]